MTETSSQFLDPRSWLIQKIMEARIEGILKNREKLFEVLYNELSKVNIEKEITIPLTGSDGTHLIIIPGPRENTIKGTVSLEMLKKTLPRFGMAYDENQWADRLIEIDGAKLAVLSMDKANFMVLSARLTNEAALRFLEKTSEVILPPAN